jgi:tripartite-type tricarboxylate transporter receptor subunit TctC
MKSVIRFFIHLCALTSITATSAIAQNFPNRPIRLIVPAAAGQAVDVGARAFARGLESIIKQPVVIENKPGAGGDIGVTAVGRSPADGYTLLFGSSSIFAGNSWLYPRNYDIEAILAPVTLLFESPAFLLKKPSAGQNIKETIAAFHAQGKSQPSVGTSATVNMVAYGMMLDHMPADGLLRIPYGSNQKAFVELIKGDLELLFDVVTSSGPLVRDGRLQAIGISSNARLTAFPTVPTFKEQGFEIPVSAWTVLSVPKATPPEVIAILNTAANKALNTTEFKSVITEESGQRIIGGSSQEARDRIRIDNAAWGRVIQKYKLKPE